MDDKVLKISTSPKLICNNLKNNTKVKQELENCFNGCNSFDLSIAFIGESGISAIEQTLLNAIANKKKGRIVTSTYLGFNTPKTFKFLLNIFKDSNVEIRIYQKEGFHPKGYIFKNDDNYKIMIGSSNLTQSALCVNQEWNICISGTDEDDVINRINNEFEEQWNDSIKLTAEWIKEYEEDYKPPLKYYVAKKGKKGFEPNKMQIEALLSLDEMRSQGKSKALLISATGTGKTFLSAFDVKQFNAKRMLFVVHRETIAKKSLESYKKIITDKKMGMFTGSEKDGECEFLFSTINTIGKNEYLNKFKPDDFDYIVIDEVHRAGADMYKNLLKHFKPKFLLGMSATPERTDDPQKIYELFDYNVAYEIRLKQAMEYDLLCPFHYFGIADLSVNGITIDEKADFNKLVSDERVKHVINAIETYGYSGDKPHGLIFVSRAEEAYALADIFNSKTDYKTIALTGRENDEARRKAIALLEENDTRKDYLDYIFTVDIFNEGIDIPCINQVVMLRATKSSIVFVQQLGRGLRKNDDKEYVTVIDIIGNYNNNYMIPIALSGSMKCDKDELRRFVYETDSTLPGCSTVSFDEITKTRIYDAIDSARLNSLQVIRDEYQKLKAKLGNKIPTLFDFDKHSSINPISIFNAKKNGKRFESYYSFLTSEEKEYKLRLNEDETRYINYISMKFASGKRIQELELIKLLLNNDDYIFARLKESLHLKYCINYDESCTTTIANELTGKFNVGSGDKYEDVILIEENDNDYKISEKFKEMLSNDDFVTVLLETIDFGISRFENNYMDRYLDTDLVLYQKYTYEDIYRLLNWEKAEVSLNVGGYKYNSYSNTFPVFINYDKTDAASTIQYQDKFINNEYIDAISKHPRNLDSNDARIIEDASKNGTKIHMFVRKNKLDDVKEFYYLGLVEKCGNFEQMKTSNGDDVFKIPYKFQTKVRQDIYSYILD